MERTTIRVDDGTLDELDAEAEEMGMTRSQYLRWLIEQRDRIREHTNDDLEDRVAELEEKVERLLDQSE